MLNEESVPQSRLLTMLNTALGPTIGRYLEDALIVEVMLNADGALWVDKLGHGRIDTGTRISPADGDRVIRIVATSVGASCSNLSPILSAELPGTGFRFQGVLPPVAEKPLFTIRKKASLVYSFERYVADGFFTKEVSEYLSTAIQQRKNIVVAGGTGSGKTTFSNAILNEIAKAGDRIVILEDTKELQCNALDYVSLRTSPEVTMRDLLKATLRLRPDRIVVGEVRGGEALDLLKAWNTGHPGGCATVHANSAEKALFRLEQLIEEAGVRMSKESIADSVNVVVFLERSFRGPKLSSVCEVSFDHDAYQFRSIL